MLVHRAQAVNGNGLSGCDAAYKVTVYGARTLYCAGTPDNASVMFATWSNPTQAGSINRVNRGGWELSGPGWSIVSPDDRALRHFTSAFPEAQLVRLTAGD